MHRYQLLVFYEDQATAARVARPVVVIAETDQAAAQFARAEVTPSAVGGRIHAIKVVEKLPIAPGVVYLGEPYITMAWPGSPQARESGQH